MIRLSLPLALTLLLLGTGCGPSDPHAWTNQGATALASGDTSKALASFEEALAALKPEDPDFARASMGHCQAQVRLDAPKAKQEFLAYAQANKGRVLEADFGLMVSELLRKGATIEAIEVMDAGVKTFPESPAMAQVKKQVEEASRQSKDPAALQKMKGLGYIGGEK